MGLGDLDVWGWGAGMCGAGVVDVWGWGRHGCVGLGVMDVWGWETWMCGETHISMGPRPTGLWGRDPQIYGAKTHVSMGL